MGLGHQPPDQRDQHRADHGDPAQRIALQSGSGDRRRPAPAMPAIPAPGGQRHAPRPPTSPSQHQARPTVERRRPRIGSRQVQKTNLPLARVRRSKPAPAAATKDRSAPATDRSSVPGTVIASGITLFVDVDQRRHGHQHNQHHVSGKGPVRGHRQIGGRQLIRPAPGRSPPRPAATRRRALPANTAARSRRPSAVRPAAAGPKTPGHERAIRAAAAANPTAESGRPRSAAASPRGRQPGTDRARLPGQRRDTQVDQSAGQQSAGQQQSVANLGRQNRRQRPIRTLQTPECAGDRSAPNDDKQVPITVVRRGRLAEMVHDLAGDVVRRPSFGIDHPVGTLAISRQPPGENFDHLGQPADGGQIRPALAARLVVEDPLPQRFGPGGRARRFGPGL